MNAFNDAGDRSARNVALLSLPTAFVWTRCGAEAGETLDAILERKERERVACGGVFLWGIGTSLMAAMVEFLARYRQGPHVVAFSPMRSKARPCDVAPARTVRWVAGTGADGAPYHLPAGAVVTSRDDVAKPKVKHYALVCRSDSPLSVAGCGALDAASLRNIRSGWPVGASQVSAVVTRVEHADEPSVYPVRLVADLVSPWFVELTQRQDVTSSK